MNKTGNTLLITGGGSGIGRGLAEAFHTRGDKVIVAGRRREALDAVVAANPGMEAMTLDIADAEAVKRFAAEITRRYPALNAVIHNAGVMKFEALKDGPAWLAGAEEMVAINVLGPLRLTAGLLPHLLTQPSATVMTVTSGLAFVPLAAAATYCATKAALHSWTDSLRVQLQDTSVEVKEIAPPYVRTELVGPQQAQDERAMPLDAFIRETLAELDAGRDELIVEGARHFRTAAREGEEGRIAAALNSMFH